MSSSSNPNEMVLSVPDWNVSSIKFMAPKTTDKGGKAITVISTQTKRNLHISTPLMMTWGIGDWMDEKGESNGRYSMALNFPNEEYNTPQTDEFLRKIKEFENLILQKAVENSELWWGTPMSLELCKHTFFPFVKVGKNKETKKPDPSKTSISAKIPLYNGKWGIQIYDCKKVENEPKPKMNLIFPCDNDNLTPIDFVPKFSQVACVLQCGGIWITGKGWGLTWRAIQCIVKPREVVSIYDRCHISLSTEEIDTLDKQVIPEEDHHESPMEEDTFKYPDTPLKAPKGPSKPLKQIVKPAPVVPEVVNTTVEDSDDEHEDNVEGEEEIENNETNTESTDPPFNAGGIAVAKPRPVVVAEPTPEPVAVAEEEPAPVAPVAVKKVIKKAVVATPPPAPVEGTVAPVAVKKVVKKKV
jgi:hypothetical protein